MRRALILVGLLVALVGCGGSTARDDTPTAPTQPTAAAPTAPVQASQATSRCVPAPEPLVAAISDGLDIAGGGSIEHVQAVKSDDFEQAWFIAGDLQGASLNQAGPIAVWVTNEIDGTGMIYSVNSFATEFSQWGDGGTTDAEFSMTDDGANEAEDCAG